MSRCVDLFSGLGGFSQAFVDRGHDVTRIDNDAEFGSVHRTYISDVWHLTAEDLLDADIVLVSPPCNCFTPMTIGHYWRGGKPNEKAQEMIDIVKHTLKIIDEAKPRYWVLENPAGMLKHVIGPPQKLTWWAAWGHDYLKPTHLWGIFPRIDWPPRPKKGSYEAAKRGAKKGVQNPKYTAAERALVPYNFSMALCKGVENGGGQTRLEVAP